MFFCQAIFSDDAYKYILDDAPASAVGLIGADAPIRKAVSNSLSASRDKSGLLLRCSSHESISTCYRKPVRHTTTTATSPSSSPTTTTLTGASSPLNSPRSTTGGSPQSTTATSVASSGITSTPGTNMAKFEDYASASIKSLSSGVEGVLKVGWCKKHQVDVYSCVVILVDWSKVGIAEKVPFEEHLLKELERAKIHFGIPTRTNTKIVLALVTSAHSLSDAPPCGGYTTIEEAQKSIHSRLDISDRSLVVLYNNAKDSYSCQRLEGMVREHASKYHKEEVARLKRTKNSIPDRAEAILAAYEGERRRPLPEHEEQSIHSKHDVEQILLARKRFKIAWHSGVSGDQKTARRNLEKCLDALSGLPKPQTVEKWVLSTIVAWKMISHNLSIVDAGARDSSRSPKIIEEVRKNVVSFLNHINWVVDLSVPANYIRNVLPNQELSRVITPPQSSESATNIQSMPEDEVLVNVMRMWYLSDFFELMAQRLERMRNLLPDDGSCAYLRGNVVLLPGFHHLCSARILQALRHYVFIREGILDKTSTKNATTTSIIAVPTTTPTFLGAESYDAPRYYKKLVFALPSMTISGRVCEYINKCISWYSRYNLRRYVLFLMRDVAEHLMFVGDYEAAIVRINRLMLDTSIAQWPELAKGLHEMRIEATKAFLDQPPEEDMAGNENDHSHHHDDDSSPNSHRKRAFNVTSPASSGLSLAPMNARLKALQDLLQSRLFILLNSSPSARGLKENLLADANTYNLQEFADKAFEEEKSLEAAGGGGMGAITSPTASARDKARISFPALNVGNDPSLQIASHARVARIRMIGSDSSAVSAFPFLRVYAHFTKPYIESMKGRLLEEEAAAASSNTNNNSEQMLLDGNASFVRGWEHGTNFGGSFPNNNASFSGATARPGILGPTTTSARSLGLTITFEASCSVPLRLYDIEVALARVLPTKEALAGRTRRARQPLPEHSLRFCHSNTDDTNTTTHASGTIPPYFVELSPKHPTWSTTVYALPSLGALEEGLVEITGLTANVLVATHVGNSVPASLSEVDVRRGDSHTSSSATASMSTNQTTPAATKSKWALYSQHPPCQYSTFDAATTPAVKDVVSMPISYNISDALGDDYLSFFEEPLFDSKEQRMKQLVRVGGGTVSRHADLSSLSNVLTVVSHQYGSTLGVGQFATKLHRPVVRITKPVPRMRLTREVSTDAEKLAMEGDDHETGFILESTGDLPENGRLLIPYLSDIAEIVDVKCYNYTPASASPSGTAKKELLPSAAEVEDVTGSDSVRTATPVGYRIASISIDPSALVPSSPGAVVPQLYVCIRWRCFYAGLFHIPLRYEYETKKCAENVVPLLAQLHVVRPFQVCSTFSELSACKTMGGEEKLLKTCHVPAPDDLDGSLRLPSPSPSRARSIATAEDCAAPTAASPPATDFNPSDFMTISYVETNRLKGLGEFAAAQKQLTEAFSRVGGNSFAAPVNHEAAMRLIRADQHQHNLISSEGQGSAAGRQMRMANQLYSTDLSQHVEGGRGGMLGDGQTPSNNNSIMVAIDVGTISVAPDNFIMRRGRPFQVRIRLTNTAKYAVHIHRAVLDLRGGLEIVSSSVVAASAGGSTTAASNNNNNNNNNTPASSPSSSGCYVLPNEEYTIVARIVGTSEINGSIPLGRALVWTRKIASFPSRGLHPESTTRDSNNDDDIIDDNSVNGTIVYPVIIPGVTISDFALHVVVSHPTTAIVGRPFNMAITVSNRSAVPSPRLRISLHGSIDRHFVPSGRIISTVPRIDSFGNAVMNISLVPVVPGNWLLPLVEVATSDKEVVASSREVRSIAIHAAELAIDGK